MKVLDLGCGDGEDLAIIKELFKCEVHGVDKENLCPYIESITDFNLLYDSKNKPFDLIISNYVIQFLDNPNELLKSVFNNLKNGGSFFLHTFDESDVIFKRGKFSESDMLKRLKDIGFINISTKTINYYDNEPSHQHWHVILEAHCQKP